jgi:hypothetical protein
MKTFFILIFAGLLITSCGNNKADQPATETDSVITSFYYLWKAMLNDTSGKLEMKKIETANLDSLTAASIIDFINAGDSSVHLDLIKTSNDTVYIKIPDATFLTQRMGSTGSTMYLAGVVYNLTELPGIRFINFDFEEGDHHAQPGTLSRDSFNNQ